MKFEIPKFYHRRYVIFYVLNNLRRNTNIPKSKTFFKIPRVSSTSIFLDARFKTSGKNIMKAVRQ